MIGSYTLEDIKPIAHGVPAKIAVCDSFEQAVLAEANGCHAAVVRNALTKRLYDRLEFYMGQGQGAQILKAEQYSTDPREVNKYMFGHKIRERVLLMSGRILKHHMKRAGFQHTRIDNYMDDGFRTGGVHPDNLGNKFVALLTMLPTTIVYARQLDKRLTGGGAGRYEYGFQTGLAEDDFVEVHKVAHDGGGMAEIYTPPEGSVLMMFKGTDHEKQTLAHLVPTVDKSVAQFRARLRLIG